MYNNLYTIIPLKQNKLLIDIHNNLYKILPFKQNIQ